MKTCSNPPTVLMLLTNAYDPDPRVRQEALALLGMGCRVRLLAWDRDLARPAFENMEGVEVERIFLSSRHGRGATQIFFYAWLYLKLLYRGLRISFDAIHCHDLDTLPAGILMGRLKRKPIVYDAHESFPDMIVENVPAVVHRSLVALENVLIRRIDLLVTVGEKLRRHFMQRGARRSVVVGNWKRLEEFRRTDEQNREMRRRHRIPEDALAVVCITQLLADRKIKELLDAADQLPDVYVVVGGKGSLESYVRERSARNPRILFIGFVSGRQIADFTSMADVIYYGFDPGNPNARFSAPNKLYEALAAGRPLITGDFGEIADVVREVGCGVVLPAYTSVEIAKALRVFAVPETRKSMAAKAKAFGLSTTHWGKGEEILHREYSFLLPGVLRKPAADQLLELAKAES